MSMELTAILPILGALAPEVRASGLLFSIWGVRELLQDRGRTYNPVGNGLPRQGSLLDVVRGLFGNYEYKVADPAKAFAFKASLLDFYNRNAERPSIRWVDHVPGDRNGMIDTVTGEILLNNDIQSRFPQLADGAEVEELLHFKQLAERQLLGKRITGAQERAMENEIEELLTQNGFEVFDPFSDG